MKSLFVSFRLDFVNFCCRCAELQYKAVTCDVLVLGTQYSVLSFEMAASMRLLEPHHQGILIGLWEGVVLSHFLSSRSKDPYLALATRVWRLTFASHSSLSRFTLTCAWTLLGPLLADVAPSIWRDTGLKSVYKALREDLRAIRKVRPRWKSRMT